MNLRLIEKLPSQVGCTPLARASVLVERPKCIPMVRLNIIACQNFYLAAKILSLGSFFSDIFTLATAQVGEEIVKAVIPVIDPMKLLRFARLQTHECSSIGFSLSAEGYMQRRQFIFCCKLHRAFN